jgi:hypothetical protein
LIVAGLATWAVLRPHGQQVARAVVDLTDRSMTRGSEALPSTRPLEIPRNTSHLEIYLPLGSSEGAYDIRISSPSGEVLVSQVAEAKLASGSTGLSVDLGISLRRPGKYLLQIRRHASEWVSFALNIR